jgi:hypothetical protein
MRQRVGVAAAIGMVIVGGVIAAVALSGGQAPTPAVARLTCAQEGVRVLTPEVLAGSDGMDLEVANSGKERRYEVHSLAGGEVFTGILPADDVARFRLSVAPGQVEFACLRVGTGERLTGRLRLLDPAGRWVPEALVCPGPDSGVFETTYAEEPFEQTARRAVPGLRSSDRLLKPGYPDTAWHGELHVVVRGGRNVGQIVRVLNHGTWNVTVDACPGTGLTQGAVAETGAT